LDWERPSDYSFPANTGTRESDLRRGRLKREALKKRPNLVARLPERNEPLLCRAFHRGRIIGVCKKQPARCVASTWLRTTTPQFRRSKSSSVFRSSLIKPVTVRPSD